MSLSYMLFMHVCLAALKRYHALTERIERIGNLSQLDFGTVKQRYENTEI
jgi:hypothetical protein